MYSIKHISREGTERVVEAVSYEFDPMKGLLTGHGCPSNNGEDITFSSGRAYVMNGEGQTVGAYNMNVNLNQ